VGAGLGASPASGGGFEVVGTGEWVRGLVEGTLRITPVVGGASPITVDAVRVQSVPTWLREYTEADADGVADVGLVFERVLITATGIASWRVGLDATGHVYIAVLGADWAWSGIAWQDTAFRDRMGFSGREEIQTVGTVKLLVAEHWMRGVHVARSGLEYINPGNVEIADALPLGSGVFASNRIGSYRRWNLGFRLTGPADDVDVHQHWLDQFIRYAWPGAPVTLYQHWGDPRRALMSHQVNAEQPAYSTLYTSERNGYQGRIDTHRSGEDQKDGVINWGGRLRSRALVAMSLAGER
jgi:hypothetical protein